MRASYYPDLKVQDNYLITGDALHHLVNVVRVEAGEELLLLNGSGLGVKALIDSVSKREMHLTMLSSETFPQRYCFDIVLGIPKREALELCLKQATELGVRKIILIRADYSQMKVPEVERMHKLLVSALEQSNASYLPELVEAEWDEVSWSDYQHKFLMDSQTQEVLGPAAKISGETALIIGPEGGFSPLELQKLKAVPGMISLCLPTPIMRTPTALAAGVGLLLQRLMD